YTVARLVDAVHFVMRVCEPDPEAALITESDVSRTAIRPDRRFGARTFPRRSGWSAQIVSFWLKDARHGSLWTRRNDDITRRCSSRSEERRVGKVGRGRGGGQH